MSQVFSVLRRKYLLRPVGTLGYYHCAPAPVYATVHLSNLAGARRLHIDPACEFENRPPPTSSDLIVMHVGGTHDQVLAVERTLI